MSSTSHDESDDAAHHPRGHVAQPDRGFAHVPVLLRRRVRQRLAPGAPGQPRGGRRRAGLHGGHRGGSARAYLAVTTWASGSPSTSSFCRASRASCTVRARRRASNWRTPAAKRVRGGRGKAAVCIPESEGGWQPVAPSAVPFRDGDPAPHALSKAEIHALIDALPRCRGAGAPRGIRRGGDPWRARLSDPRVSVAAEQPAHGRIWRHAGQPAAFCAGSDGSGARRVARAPAAVLSNFGHRLGSGRLDCR